MPENRRTRLLTELVLIEEINAVKDGCTGIGLVDAGIAEVDYRNFIVRVRLTIDQCPSKNLMVQNLKTLLASIRKKYKIPSFVKDFEVVVLSGSWRPEFSRNPDFTNFGSEIQSGARLPIIGQGSATYRV